MSDSVPSNVLNWLTEMAERQTAPAADEDPPDGPVPVETLAPRMRNGFYTITFPDGSHKTLRVRTSRDHKFAFGKRIVGLLIGPENTSDYEDFAFMFEDKGVVLWKRYRDKKVAEYADLLWYLGTVGPIEGFQLRADERCLICNRPLTDPVSIDTGIGPICRGRQGL